MSHRARCALLVALALVLVAPAASSADPPPGFTFLPGAGRGISRGTSASRDAPVMEYAYGPRAQASLGAEPAIFAVVNPEGRVWRLGIAALAALENDRKTQPLPKELWRSRIDLFLALELPLAGGFPKGSALETAVGVGRESADWFGYSRPATPPAWGMPFGGGGDWLSFDAALRLPLGSDVLLVLRVSDRVYWNALPRLAGDRSVSDAIGDGLREGPVNVASAESVLRWRALSWAHPTLAVYGEHAFARDPYTADTFFGRAMVGFVVPGRTGEMFPFASFDGGNGRGMLVDRRELRFSVGGRLVTFLRLRVFRARRARRARGVRLFGSPRRRARSRSGSLARDVARVPAVRWQPRPLGRRALHGSERWLGPVGARRRVRQRGRLVLPARRCTHGRLPRRRARSGHPGARGRRSVPAAYRDEPGVVPRRSPPVLRGARARAR